LSWQFIGFSLVASNISPEHAGISGIQLRFTGKNTYGIVHDDRLCGCCHRLSVIFGSHLNLDEQPVLKIFIDDRMNKKFFIFNLRA
tara:strand:+ start:231 stop:488 length:258 start_codon:yes stop_codon:yes gene_type:complete